MINRQQPADLPLSASLQQWLLPVVALAVALTAAIAIVALRQLADESRQGEILLAQLDGQSHRLSALEWQAIANQELEPELLEEVGDARQQMEGILGQLTRLNPNGNLMQRVLENYREYIATVDEEFQLIAMEDLDGAKATDEERVDPAFDSLAKAIADAGAQYGDNANQTYGIVDAGSAVLVVVSVLVISLLLWRLQQVRYAVVLAAAEQKLLREANDNLETEVQKRKQTEAASCQSQAELRALFAAMNDVVIVYDREGCYLKIAPTNASLLYKPPDEMLGKTLHDVLPTPQADLLLNHIQLALEKQQTVTVDYSLNIDGREIWFAGMISPMPNEAAVLVARDITKRKWAEAALHESERRWRETLENVELVAVGLDLEGRITFCNDFLLRLSGWSQAEVMGRNWFEVFVPLQPEVRAVFAESTKAASVPLHYENPLVTRQGELRWISWNNTMLRDANGKVIGTISLGEDITERRQAEENLREAEARYRALVENIPAVVYIDVLDQTDPARHRTSYISPQITALLGYAPEEATQLPAAWPDWVHPDDRGQELAADRQHYLTGAPLAQEYRMIRRDGRVVWVRDEAVILQDAEGRFQYSQGVLLDITERKQAEEQLKESLHEKEVLLKEIHHRVKNNLQIISSLLNLQAKSITDSQVLGLLRDSQNRVKSMALVHEKLYRSSDLARIDFAEYVQSLTAQLFRSYAHGSGAVELQTHIEGLWLDVDTAVPCGLIINELVSNALKHAFSNGRAGQICVELVRNKTEQLTLRVSDDGAGFPADVDYRNTTSLGLQLVNTLADQIGGTVELERRQGTVFKIAFTPPGVEEKRQ